MGTVNMIGDLPGTRIINVNIPPNSTSGGSGRIYGPRGGRRWDL